ncbi:gfo/Idh/MocA family oxidoreductase [Marinobacter nanhaiticus D15-8W]|uniref:Gfo/Idh/MocA family oxidoreductase n=2 Tax=Marinobacter TaxID=2742 RepID=N6WYT9_9GAMM|nr:gfo/Idh/MocA family oxidoreductase [Marinobacter nanhaiticus D15-8W]
MPVIKIAIVGFGKIARDQHYPALFDSPAYQLAAVASPDGAGPEGVDRYDTLDAMLDAVPDIDAVTLCVPPSVRYVLAAKALARGKHVMLEKPPGTTLNEVAALQRQAEKGGKTLFAAWHSRFAPAVEPARTWLDKRKVRSVDIQWKEDVRVWHPGQDWIWEPGGMGVFDPGINGLSIATAILGQPFFLRKGVLEVPANRQTPIAADLYFESTDGYPVSAVFDSRQTGPQLWDIHVTTDEGRLTLSKGGSQMFVDGELQHEAEEREYPGLYQRFAELVESVGSEVDATPLQHVADAFLLSERRSVDPFYWNDLEPSE